MTPPMGRGSYNNTVGSKQGKGGGGGKGRGGGGGGAISMSVPPRPASSPPHPNLSGNKKQPRGQGTTTTPISHPKSKEVIRLEKLLKALHDSSSSSSGGKAQDPEGGCFCLARDHPLSNYTPICRTCGLILCSMNLPQYACPFCAGALLSPEEKRSLGASLEKEIEDIQAREEKGRQREAQEAKRAAGEFPTLLDSMGSKQQQQQSSQLQVPGARGGSGAHKVLSVKSAATKGRASRVVVSSRSYSSTPVGSRPASRGPDQEEERKQAPRVPHPGREPKHADRVVDPERPYANLLLGRA